MLEYLSFLLHLNSELTAQYASIYSKVCIMRLIILKDAPELSDFVQYIANQNMTKKTKFTTQVKNMMMMMMMTMIMSYNLFGIFGIYFILCCNLA